jgi:endonuclease G
MNLSAYLFFLLAGILSLTFSVKPAMETTQLELPSLKQNETITSHTGFSLCYQEEYEQASWVAYELTAEETEAVTGRTNKFITDPMIATGSATQDDYAGSGYDRGHLAPAADMGWSEQTMMESFYFSNMSPQLPSFNRGIWKTAEEQVRSWARLYGTVYVATGPVLEAGLPTIGVNKVAIPGFYYKVLLRCMPDDTSGIGLLIPHKTAFSPLSHFLVSIDSVEQVTGIDFFPKLNDTTEERIEAGVPEESWPMIKIKREGGSTPKKPTTAISGESVQCMAITKSGVRCKRRTTNPNSRCFSHQ